MLSVSAPARKKGHFVTPMSTTVHENPEVFGEHSTHFDGFQWAETNKDAVMTGPAHIVFGLGRFACPGRLLAINGQHHSSSYFIFRLKYSPIRDQAHRACAHRASYAHFARRALRGDRPSEHGDAATERHAHNDTHGETHPLISKEIADRVVLVFSCYCNFRV